MQRRCASVSSPSPGRRPRASASATLSGGALAMRRSRVSVASPRGLASRRGPAEAPRLRGLASAGPAPAGRAPRRCALRG
eukprot:5033773-Heterocapsa_arctica.AAC.1